MKRASYREAIAFAADLDTGVTDPKEMTGLITVVMIATLFGVDAAKVVTDVNRRRGKDAPPAEVNEGWDYGRNMWRRDL